MAAVGVFKKKMPFSLAYHFVHSTGTQAGPNGISDSLCCLYVHDPDILLLRVIPEEKRLMSSREKVRV